MKLIENSIDSENLQTSISHADIDTEMASCDVVTVNGHNSNEESSSKKVMENVSKLTTLTNGSVHSEKKCNGNLKVDDDDMSDDFQLFLEPSSDEGSPMKKIDDDSISAPQIVQEIEDLLGIDSSNVHELEKDLEHIDGTESIDLNEKEDEILLNIEDSEKPEKNNDISISQDIEDVFEDPSETPKIVDSENKESTKREPSKTPESGDCDLTSDMSVIFHEVEIGPECAEIQESKKNATKNLKNNIELGHDEDHIIKSSVLSNSVTTKLESKEKRQSEELVTKSENDERSLKKVSCQAELSKPLEEVSETKTIEEVLETKTTEVVPVTKIIDEVSETNITKEFPETTTTEEVSDEMPSSQTSLMSGSSVEWTVLDAVEDSDDEKFNCSQEEITKVVENDKVVNPQNKLSINDDESIFDEKENSNNIDNKTISNIQEEKNSDDCHKIEEVKQAKITSNDDHSSVKNKNLDSDDNQNDCLLKGKGESLLSDKVETKSEIIIKSEDKPSCKLISKENSQGDDFYDQLQVANASIKIATEGEGTRKRIASDDVDDGNIKKSKLENEERKALENIISTSVVFKKRRSSDTVENEAKRTKKNDLELGSLETIEGEEIDHIEIDSNDTRDVEETESLITINDSDPDINSSSKEEKIKKENDPTQLNSIEKKITTSDLLDSSSNSIPEPNDKSSSDLATTQNSKTNELQLIKVDSSTVSFKETVEDEGVTKSTELCNSNSVEKTIPVEGGDTPGGKAISIFQNPISEKGVQEGTPKKTTEDEVKENNNKNNNGATNKNKSVNQDSQIKEVSTPNSTSKTYAICISKIKRDIAESLKDAIHSSDDKHIKKSEQKEDSKKDENKKEHSITSNTPFDMLKKNMEKNREQKKKSNLDLAIDRVVEKARSNRILPVLKKFHKDQLKKLTRSELEEAVVSKMCEAITDRSELGQLRLRCQSLEQNNEVWRKKAMQFEKQNRELEMVLKRFLAETTQIKQNNQLKVALPIKVTRSVGLQVVLASSMHGTLVASRNKLISDLPSTSQNASSKPRDPLKPTTNTPPATTQQQQRQQQQQQQRQQLPKRPEKEIPKEPVKSSTFSSPVQPLQRRVGRPNKIPTSTSSSSSPQPSPPKVIPMTTPAKPVTPLKMISTPGKDLEVIDLTDKEEKTKASQPTPPQSGTIRVAPSTQICFVQQTPTNTPPQQMAYLVQKPGQRQPTYVVTTSSTPSPQRPMNTMARQPPGLAALPVFRGGGQVIPVQNNQQVRAVATVVPSTSRQITQVRVHPQVTSTVRHPAPLPAAPPLQYKPNLKAPPPKPQLKIAKTNNGIMLSWSMTLVTETAEMASYQLYAYQESNQPPSTNLWKKVGDVKALPLPMACTLTQFIEGHKYHFAVRAVDVHGRIGPFSLPSTILLTK